MPLSVEFRRVTLKNSTPIHPNAHMIIYAGLYE